MPRIVRFYKTGGPEVLCLEEAAPETPAAGEVRLKIEAIGINNSEAQYRRGVYPMKTTSFPTRLGREASGVVEAVGAGVTGVTVGDKVSTIPAFDIERHGVYGEWAVVPAVALAKVPDKLSRVEAAAVFQQYLTVYGPFVEYTDLMPGDAVVIVAAASSVGRGAIQVARMLGCTVIATTRSPSKRDILLEGGAQHVVVSGTDDLVATVNKITNGQGARLIFDPVAGPGLGDLVKVTAPGGIIFEYGQLSGQPTPYPLLTCLRKGLSIRGYTLWEITLNPDRCARAKAWIYAALEARSLRPAIDRIFPLDRIVDAHRYIESGQQTGKIVVTVT